MTRPDRDEGFLELEKAPDEERESADEVMLERLLAQPFTLGEYVRDDTRRELSRRDGEWGAFSAQVFDAIDREAVEARRMSLEERAISTMRREVEGELGELGPRFEGAFQKELEDRIWRAAKTRPTIGAALTSWLEAARGWWSGQARTFGLLAATATAAVALAVVVPRGPAPQLGAASAPGTVRVDRVSFEGTVTVMEQGGMAVVWLSGASS